MIGEMQANATAMLEREGMTDNNEEGVDGGEESGLLVRLNYLRTQVEGSGAVSGSVEEVQCVLKALEEVQTRVRELSLFSASEGIDELPTRTLSLLLVDYYMGLVIEQSYTAQRLRDLERAKVCFEAFIVRCEHYGVVEDQSVGSDRRAALIGRFRRKRELEGRIDLDSSRGGDEEAMRSFWLDKLRFSLLSAQESLEAIAKESDILHSKEADLDSRVPQPSRQPEDLDSCLDRPNNQSALLDNSGKVRESLSSTLLTNPQPLRNFIITSLPDREQRKKNVFRADYSLPTMSIEEYLEAERQRNGILTTSQTQLSAPSHETQSTLADDEASQVETYKAREWDEFKEANPKGSGNTMGNRG